MSSERTGRSGDLLNWVAALLLKGSTMLAGLITSHLNFTYSLVRQFLSRVLPAPDGLHLWGVDEVDPGEVAVTHIVQGEEHRPVPLLVKVPLKHVSSVRYIPAHLFPR
jgi:hypothetical protein